MRKAFFVLVFVLLLSIPITSFGQGKCSLPADTFGGQKNIVGVVTQSKLSIKDGRHHYDFTYRLPNGKTVQSWVEFDLAGTKVEVGDLHIWLPANDKVRSLNPTENRHVPILVKKRTCKQIQLDFSSPAKDIPTQ